MVLDCYRRRDQRRCRLVNRITLDGRDVDITRVYKVDTRRGRIWAYVRDAAGRFMVDREREGAVREELRGRVRVFYRLRWV